LSEKDILGEEHFTITGNFIKEVEIRNNIKEQRGKID
jgi:hypothetical protein